MTNRQIEIGDNLLKTISAEKGILHQSIYIEHLKKEFGYDQKEIIAVGNILIHNYKLLIRAVNDDYTKIITEEGGDAIKIGLREYIKRFEKAKARPIRLSWIAIGISVILPLGIKFIDYKINKPKPITIESKFIKAVSDSLKNDTTFIKEIIKKSHNQ